MSVYIFCSAFSFSLYASFVYAYRSALFTKTIFCKQEANLASGNDADAREIQDVLSEKHENPVQSRYYYLTIRREKKIFLNLDSICNP